MTTVKLFCHSGIVSVHHVVTLPAMRRRGIGSAMTVHALREARDRGFRIAGLTSSPDGPNVYRPIGFRALCTFSRYRWSPDGQPT